MHRRWLGALHVLDGLHDPPPVCRALDGALIEKAICLHGGVGYRVFTVPVDEVLSNRGS